MTFAIIAGTRPEIIKQYPLIRLLDREEIDYKFIYTGQHYDYELSEQFIQSLIWEGLISISNIKIALIRSNKLVNFRYDS